jgi:drug/metabolite transporter (DMT)-like permease
MNNTFLYIVTVVIWGSTWLAIEYQLGVVEPEVSITYRYLLAAVILFIWSKINRLKLLFNVKDHIWFALLGLLLFCLNYILAYRAQIHITSALAAIAFSTILWINIFLARLVFGTRAGRRVLFGAFLGIVGILVLFVPQIERVSLSDEVFFGSVGPGAARRRGGFDRQYHFPSRPETFSAGRAGERMGNVIRCNFDRQCSPGKRA